MDQTGKKRRVIMLALVGASIAGSAFAQAKVKKASVRYQTSPSGEERCGLCVNFIPSLSGQGPGTCKIVAGSISPSGWCAEFEAKPKPPARKKA
jgi:hypothetical protein